MARFKISVAVFCLLLPGVDTAYASVIYKYDVYIPKQLNYFNVKVCFTNRPPPYLYVPDDYSNSHFQNIYLISGNNKAHLNVSRERRLYLAGVKIGDCVLYTATIHNDYANSRFMKRLSSRTQRLVTLNQWLWRPKVKGKASIAVSFHLPDRFKVSAPGRLIQSSRNKKTYLFSSRPADWEGRVAVGLFDKVVRVVNGARIEIGILKGNTNINLANIKTWLNANLNALNQTFGQLPLKDLQVLVMPVGSSREVVPWGQVLRGAGNTVLLYIDQTRPLSEFMRDWVFIHELGHLLHPRLSGNGNWLSEGLASYYQNVLRARAKMFSRMQAWLELDAGFDRGIKGNPANKTLVQAADTMSRDRLYMRVYWSGAAISLLADSRLRIRTNNKMSLDKVIKKFFVCCMPADRYWTALELMQKWDQLSNTRVFTELYKQYAHSTFFPVLGHLYKQLGIIKKGSKLKLSNSASNVLTRKKIMNIREKN